MTSSKTRVLITGSNGLIGSETVGYFDKLWYQDVTEEKISLTTRNLEKKRPYYNGNLGVG